MGSSPTPNTHSMLNCPGSNAPLSPFAGSRVNVMYRVFPSTPAEPTTDAEAWDCRVSWSKRSLILDCVHVQELEQCCLQSLLHNCGNPLHQFIAQVMVLLAFCAETFAI